jgi:hypothetical protein
MTRGRQVFRKRELTRSIKAAEAAGKKVDRVEVDPISGRIVVYFGNGGDDPKLNTADAVLMKLEKLKHGQSQ